MKQLHIVQLNGAEFIPSEDIKVVFIGKFLAVFWV